MRTASFAFSSIASFALLAVAAWLSPVAAMELDLSAWSETFAGCRLQEVKGDGLSIDSYACGADHGNAHLEADRSVDGFVEVSDGPDGPMRTLKIRTFRKSAAAPLSALLPAIRAASPGPYTASCALEPALADDDTGARRFMLAPTGEAKTAWDASVDGGAPMEAPCGPLGVQFDGDRFFEVLQDDPTTIAFIDAGSEIQIFIPATLKSTRH